MLYIQKDNKKCFLVRDNPQDKKHNSELTMTFFSHWVKHVLEVTYWLQILINMNQSVSIMTV